MKRNGFTLIEILIVITIMSTLAGLISIAAMSAQRRSMVMQCQSHVRDLALLIENASETRYPKYGGPELLLYLVQRGEVAGRDSLSQLFCPGDAIESFEDAGGVEAYRDLDLAHGGLGCLTSYAGRAFDVREFRVGKGLPSPVVLIADDSDDHHQGGYVVGLTGGVAKFRDKIDDWDLAVDTPVAPGADSPVEELRPLRAE